MKTYQVILIVIAVLAVNNLALLTLVGYFSENQRHSGQSTGLSNTSQSLSSDEAVDYHDFDEVTLAVEEFVNSYQFTEVLDNWEKRSRRRDEKIGERLADLDSQELHLLSLDTDSDAEREIAFDLLVEQGKLEQLSNDEIKALYVDLENGQSNKAILLALLLDKDDPEALEWAKESFNDSSFSNGSSSEIYAAVYDEDPIFVENHITGVEFDPTQAPPGLLEFVQQVPNLANLYYSQNFDKILSSSSDDVFGFIEADVNIQLSYEQQSKLVSLFASSSGVKRDFAIGLAGIMDDSQLLRDAYSNITRSQDKSAFLASLLSSSSSDVSDLAVELALNSDDPDIQRLANVEN